MLTIDIFDKIPAGKIFLTGELSNEPGGLYMTDSNIGGKLTWIAKKGYNYDWCIYCHWSMWSVEHIARHGEKVVGEVHIQRCVPCDNEVFKRYRY